MRLTAVMVVSNGVNGLRVPVRDVAALAEATEFGQGAVIAQTLAVYREVRA